MNRDVMLWIYALAGPLVWFLSMETNFALAPLAPESRIALYLVSLSALVITALAGYFAWINWRRLSREDTASGRGPSSRQALSLGGVFVSLMFFLVILAQTIPNLSLKGTE